MPLWSEYRRIKKESRILADEDTKILLNLISEIMRSWDGTQQELKNALYHLDIARNRIHFYQNIHYLKEVK